jgi:radical SAM protein (TIGR01212 family)
MMEPKRYNAFSDELKRVFGCRIHRISIDAGFTCPNRDGTLGDTGCIYCSKGSGASGIARGTSVTEQIELAKDGIRRRFKADRFLAYFQAYSNTYKDLDILKRLYDEALSVKDVAGLIVSTRPDCLPEGTLDLLESYAKKTYFWLELGLQSPIDRTLEFIKRGHDLSSFVDAVKRCKERGIRVCAHVILGLPGESREEMISSADILNGIGIDGVKIHLLHVIKGARLEEMFLRGEVRVMEREEYVGLVCDYIERLRPQVIVQRLTGEGMRETLVAPLWSLNKFEVLNEIDKELRRRGSFQGSIFNSSSPNL